MITGVAASRAHLVVEFVLFDGRVPVGHEVAPALANIFEVLLHGTARQGQGRNVAPQRKVGSVLGQMSGLPPAFWPMHVNALVCVYLRVGI